MAPERRLTQLFVKHVRAEDKPQKYFDGGGLYLLVNPSGTKLWRYKYRFEGREQLLSLGQYPEVTLADARVRHGEARKVLLEGRNPSALRREQKLEEEARAWRQLSAVCEGWLSSYRNRVTAKRFEAVRSSLERHCLPYLGKAAVSELRPGILLRWLGDMERRGIGLAAIRETRIGLKMALDWAVAREIIEVNPLSGGNLTAQVRPYRAKHHRAPENAAEIGRVLRAMEAPTAGTSLPMMTACRVLPRLAVRPAELVSMQWRDIDWNTSEWRFEASKTRRPMIVPLARQVIEMLKPLWPITGASGFVFSLGANPMRVQSISKAMRRLGDVSEVIVPHGWRSVFSTFGREVLGFQDAWIELQLGHRVVGPLGDTYNRAKFLEQRREMMQQWSDYLDELRDKAGSEVLA